MMKNPIFTLLLLLCNCLRGFLYPFLAEILPFFSTKLRARRDFERLNLVDPLSRPYRLDGLSGQILFHVSSEGELEQIRPLISYYLEQRQYLELAYTSESVEKKCQDLAVEAAGRLRLFRLPLLTYFFFSWKGAQSLQSWSSAKRIVMCRYDFFPELLLFGSASAHHFVLVNATLKGKEALKGLKRWYMHSVYRLFNVIICATQNDKMLFRQIVDSKVLVDQFDFRIIQIERRVSSADITMKNKKLQPLLSQLQTLYPVSKRLVMGSAWPKEMAILKQREFAAKVALGDLLLFIAPHQLSSGSIEQFERQIGQMAKDHQLEIPIYVIKKNATIQDIEQLSDDLRASPGVIISQVPGILCELYRFFGHAFVGGGHGRSIHSVLEPFIAGAHIFCGPKHHRSTEYDFVREYSPDAIVEVTELENFYSLFKEHENFAFDKTTHQHFISKSVGRFLAIVQQLHLG